MVNHPITPGAIKSAFLQNVKRPDLTTLAPEYVAPIQSTAASYQTGNTSGQTSDEVAQAMMDQIIAVEQPPAKVQTNPKIDFIFKMQLADATGEAGVKAGHARFLSGATQQPAAAAQPATSE
jgi:hypothetical protein